MEKNDVTLSSFLEQDRDMVTAQLARDRGPEQALKVLEKETDRLLYRAGELSDAKAGAAQNMLQVLKNALPLVDCVSEAEVWEKESGDAKVSVRRLPLPSVLSLAAGCVCVIAGLINQASAKGALRLTTVLWMVAGGVLLVLGGYFAGKGGVLRGGRKGNQGSRKEARQLQQTFLVDPGRIWHILQGTLLGADHSLELIEENAGGDAGEGALSSGAMSKKELQFFAELLENAYARRRQSPSDETLREQVESIRYYLHEKGIETEDYTVQSARWFEILPSQQKAVTIRPAMLQGGIVIMKGIASGQL